jgi:hypothetical protein
MGYKVQRTGYKVAIEDRPGLELTIRPMSVDQILEFTELAESVSDLDMDNPGIEEIKAFRKVLTEFAELIEAWNLEEDDDTPIPATWDGFKTLGLPFAMELMQASIQAITQAPPPLPGASPTGSIDAQLRELLGS